MTALSAAVVYDDHDGEDDYAHRRREWEQMHVYAMQHAERRVEDGKAWFARGPCAQCGTRTVIVGNFPRSKKWSLCSTCAGASSSGTKARRWMDETYGLGTREEAAASFRSMVTDFLSAVFRRSRKKAA